MFFEYHPTVVHDLHESIPLLQTWNGTGPYNPNLDPIAINELLETCASPRSSALTALGMPGVWTWGFGEGWGHHYLDSVAINHNSVGRGYETFGNGTRRDRRARAASDRRALRRQAGDGPGVVPAAAAAAQDVRRGRCATTRTTWRPAAWRSSTTPPKNAKEMLRNFYRKGYNSWQKGVKGKPYAFVIPEDQGDRAARGADDPAPAPAGHRGRRG